MLVSLNQIFSGYTLHENDHPYSDEIQFDKKRGVFWHRVVACFAGIDGTCQCNSHDTYRESKLSPDEGLALIRKWGYTIKEEEDWQKIRRRIEDALRKTASPAQLYAIAGVLNVRLP